MKTDGKVYLKMIEELIDIASNYTLAKRMLLIQSDSLGSGDVDIFNPYYQFIDRVNKSFLKLDNLYKEIITNEFFSPEDSLWWQMYYTQKNFVDYKGKAMKAFLGYYHELI